MAESQAPTQILQFVALPLARQKVFRLAMSCLAQGSQRVWAGETEDTATTCHPQQTGTVS